MIRSSVVVVLVAVGCGSDDPCEGVEGACIAIEAGASASEIQAALIEVPAGGTVAFAGGTYDVDTELSLDVDDVTVRGAGMNATTLSFARQTTGGQGMLVTANGFTIEDIGLEDSPGDALKVLGAQGVTIRRVRAEWTGGPSEQNGAYGLYPVQCSDVIIEDSVVEGASDAGIYVGQSDRIVVRRNRAAFNVAGIEIENSSHADVHDNVATDNTGGILVFNLPDLQVKNGAGTRVFANEVVGNNTDNFAPAGNIVANIPRGTGIVLLAAHQVEIFENTLGDHDAINIGIISYVPTGNPVTDVAYDQYPTGIDIHDNVLTGVSDKPTGTLGALLLVALGELYTMPPYIVPDIAWDGVLDPARMPNDADRICIHDNGDADFINLAWPLNEGDKPALDLAPHACAHAPLPQVDL